MTSPMAHTGEDKVASGGHRYRALWEWGFLYKKLILFLN
jgi:hypothetical protein